MAIVPAIDHRKEKWPRFISKFARHKATEVILYRRNSLIQLVFQHPARALPPQGIAFDILLE